MTSMTTAHPPTLFYLPISLQCLCAVQEVVCTYYYYLPPNTLPLLPFIYATLSFLWAPKAPGVLGLGSWVLGSRCRGGRDV